MREALTLVIVFLLLPAVAWGGCRSREERAAFVHAHPCPATGKAYGTCPGWVVDHVIPLCAGGPDKRSNMQWQTIEDARIKDRDERRLCRS